MQKVCGVYKIVNILDYKFYIGSSVDIKNRWKQHKSVLRKGSHHSSYLQYSWNKYGEQAFKMEIIEECEPTKETLLAREQYWIDLLKPEYNLCPKTGSRLGSKQPEGFGERIGAKMRGQKRRPATPEEIDRNRQIGLERFVKGKEDLIKSIWFSTKTSTETAKDNDVSINQVRRIWDRKYYASITQDFPDVERDKTKSPRKFDSRSGKSFDEKYGVEDAARRKEKMRQAKLGKTYEEIMGVEKAMIRKQSISRQMLGNQYAVRN